MSGEDVDVTFYRQLNISGSFRWMPIYFSLCNMPILKKIFKEAEDVN